MERLVSLSGSIILLRLCDRAATSGTAGSGFRFYWDTLSSRGLTVIPVPSRDYINKKEFQGFFSVCRLAFIGTVS